MNIRRRGSWRLPVSGWFVQHRWLLVIMATEKCIFSYICEFGATGVLYTSVGNVK
jgi:hypothetical protein